jgi:hypothetical protein
MKKIVLLKKTSIYTYIIVLGLLIFNIFFSSDFGLNRNWFYLMINGIILVFFIILEIVLWKENNKEKRI